MRENQKMITTHSIQSSPSKLSDNRLDGLFQVSL